MLHLGNENKGTALLYIIYDLQELVVHASYISCPSISTGSYYNWEKEWKPNLGLTVNYHNVYL
jgi:hypothetical protein